MIRKQNIEKFGSETIINKLQAIEKEIYLFQSKITANTGPEAQAYSDHAQKMLNLARENFNRNYLFVVNGCVETRQGAIEKLRSIL